MIPNRCGEAWSEIGQPGYQDWRHRWPDGRRFDAVLCHRICRIESPLSRKSPPGTGGNHRHGPRHQPWLCLMFPQWTTRSFNVSSASVAPEGLCSRNAATVAIRFTAPQSGALVARLRPTGSNDMFEVLYWSLWKNRWASTGPFGRTVLSIDDALRFIAYEDIFWVTT
jgi:hypothetical protein